MQLSLTITAWLDADGACRVRGRLIRESRCDHARVGCERKLDLPQPVLVVYRLHGRAIIYIYIYIVTSVILVVRSTLCGARLKLPTFAASQFKQTH